MRRPVTGPHRLALSLNGLWALAPDPEDRLGPEAAQAPEALAFAVPGSWNEQLAEADAPGLGPGGLADYVGACWVGRRVFVPEAARGRRVFVRAGSADYKARVFVDGREVGRSEAAFLPFMVEVTAHVAPGRAFALCIRVDNRLGAETIPQGIATGEAAEPKERGAGSEHFPPARFDFYPYGGLHRDVDLVVLPPAFLRDVRVDARPDGALALEVDVDASSPEALENLTVHAAIGGVEAEAPAGSGTARLALRVPDTRPWSPDDPRLYPLTLTLRGPGSEPLDQTEQPVGFREVRVEGGRLLLNDAPVFLRGFGKHEDAPLVGKAHTPAVLVRDFELLRWIGADSFRTSHYPYDEAWLDEADRRGVLVLSEVPAVSLNHFKATDSTQRAHAAAIRALVRRDRNHPSVVAWVIGNEPGLSGEPEATDETASRYWAPLFDLTRTLDPTRPVTVPVHARGPGRAIYPLADFCAINRYYGWYTEPGRLDVAARLLREELDEIWAAHGKPVFVSEFGADTLAGAHSVVPRQFTEEYQAALIEAYLDVIEHHPAACGAHIWNFADFRTPQNFRRVVDNLKGVFTRARGPKRAAFALRARWTGRRGPGMHGL